jgi:dihydropyrimidinase
VSSDHAPYSYDDPKGKRINGTDAPFSKIPNGLPGLEARLPILFSEGVSKGRIDLPTFVGLSATNAAKVFGLYPQKGTIAIGSDADIAIWDPSRKVTLGQSMMHHAVDYTPYEGLEVLGYPVMTIARGDVVWDDGEVDAAPGRGRFLPRAPYDYIKPAGRFVTPFNPVDRVLVDEETRP